ncbi:hypothetical protein CR203_22725 [Salipaludibacillus neizhouensis]|uniref:Uncharacterized protein n=1 Tax=Salipaludibacillus neizhouensis TaxID=885475 RepID=A0A3A9KCI0_9BACI|nr:hypothetical protein [Salipaludibacillus neizhouensis]RKL65085.1 hypothetical protein CR203_22725 [Salipaludibacillus neizhouensis]
MLQLEIDQKAIQNFNAHFGYFIEEHIVSYYNPDFVLVFSPFSYSMSFLKNEIIVSKIEDNRIVDVIQLSYRNLIPDSFLTHILSLDSIPSRIFRYRDIGLNRLRAEIIDELRLGAITAADKIAIWDDYHIIIKISYKLQMENILR